MGPIKIIDLVLKRTTWSKISESVTNKGRRPPLKRTTWDLGNDVGKGALLRKEASS